MRRTLKRILVFTLVGCAAQIAVAWLLAATDFPAVTASRRHLAGSTPWTVTFSSAQGIDRVTATPFALVAPTASPSPRIPDDIPLNDILGDLNAQGDPGAMPRVVQSHFVSAGWPWRSLRGVAESEQSGRGPWLQPYEPGYPAPTSRSCVVLKLHDSEILSVSMLPLLPAGPGFVLDTLLYGAIAAASWHLGRRAVAHSRRAAGRCPRCGYPVVGLLACPECGEPVRDAA